LRLICEDSDGYFDLHLDYKDIEMTPQETSLLCLIAHLESAEVDYDEIDLVTTGAENGGVEGSAPPVFVHRLLWNTSIWTGSEVRGPNALDEERSITFALTPEIEFRFRGLEIKMERKTDHAELLLSRPAGFIRVVRDPGKIEGMDALFTSPP